jgi:hypothetical protein
MIGKRPDVRCGSGSMPILIKLRRAASMDGFNNQPINTLNRKGRGMKLFRGTLYALIPALLFWAGLVYLIVH